MGFVLVNLTYVQKESNIKENEQKESVAMKKIIGILLALTIALTIITTEKSENAIIIYSCMEQFRNDKLQEQLKKQFPELDVYVMYMSTAKAAAKLSIEGTSTDADIVVNLENAYMEKVEDYMADVQQYSHLEYETDMVVESGKYLIWDRQAGSVIVNRKILEKNNLPIPETYEDLLKSIYKGLISMPDPKSSGTGYFFLKNLVNTMGEDAAFAYIDELAKNIKQFTESGSGPIKLLIQGEVAIGLGLTFQAVNELNNGNDFLIMEPEFGSPYSLTSVSMLAGREHSEDIVRVFEFIVNDYMVYDKMYGSPEKVLVDQINGIKNYPTNITYGDMSGIESAEEKERLLEKWKY